MKAAKKRAGFLLLEMAVMLLAVLLLAAALQSFNGSIRLLGAQRRMLYGMYQAQLQLFGGTLDNAWDEEAPALDFSTSAQDISMGGGQALRLQEVSWQDAEGAESGNLFLFSGEG